MKCQQCGRSTNKLAKYCSRCGAVVAMEGSAFALWKAQHLESEGRTELALAQYEACLDLELSVQEESAVRKHLGNLHFRLGHLRHAVRQLQRAAALAGEVGAIWHDLGVVQYHLADFEGAAQSFRQALRHDPDMHLSYFWLGNSLYHRGKMDEAVSAFEELLERYPNFAVGHFHLGVIHAREGRQRQAEQEFEHVLRQNPEDVPARHYIS